MGWWTSNKVGRSGQLAALAGTAVMAVLTGCESAPLVGSGAVSRPRPAQMEGAASKASPAIGRPAPDFTLTNQEGQPVSLHDQRGKWVVLYFYPQNDTPGCACQATDFTALLTQFRAMDAVILGVSPDSPESHRHFRQKHGLDLTLLSDPQATMMRPYGAWVDGGFGEGRVVRSTYIIDPQGRIAWHWPEVMIPTGHADRVRAKLEELSGRRG